MKLIHSYRFIHRVKLYMDRVTIISPTETGGKHNGIMISALGASLTEVIAEERGRSADGLVT